MTAFDQPLLQRVRAEVLLHDENRAAVGRESAEPAFEHGVKFGLADLDRRVAPHEVEAKIGIDLVGIAHVEVRHAESTRVAFGEFACAGVDVDGDHVGPRTTASEGQGDRTGSAAEIEEYALVGWRRSIGEQELGSGVEATVREHPVIGLDVEGVVGQDDRHETRS